MVVGQLLQRVGIVRLDPGALRPFMSVPGQLLHSDRGPAPSGLTRSTDARDFGILDGFLIPVASTAGNRMGQIWFGGRTLDLPERQLPALHLMAIYAFDRSSNFTARLRGTTQG